ncbi:MAG: SxtJ family membrane protein, partial [Candidatus Fermentibacteria bacterium]|nr:SxtJ family membrane protein [Candidatus Fermentibacteria bacterium]
MSLINSRQNKTKAELRKYGLVMFAAFGVISGLLFWQERPAWVFTAVPSLLFLVFALAFPGALAPVEKFWMKLAAVLGYIMTNVLLSLVFVLAIIPTGFILRILGKTPIKKGFAENSSSSSNWNFQ